MRLLNKHLESADGTLYHAHVIHALAFAVKGHNNATRTLARTAMAICDNLPEATRGYLRGREAAYLACIAARRSAKGRRDLATAEEYLAQAVARENPGTETVDVRFKSERLAIATRRVHFDYSCDGRTDDSGIREIVRGLTAVVVEAGDEGSARVRHWVLRQALTNYFTLVLILKHVAGGAELPLTMSG